MYQLLIVEDEHLIRNTLQRAFQWEHLGFAIAGAVGDGAQALAFARSRPVDVVLSDIKMPGMDGMEMLRQLRTEFPAVAVVLLTAHADFNYARQALESQVFAYILKLDLLTELEPVMRRLRTHLDEMCLTRRMNDHMHRLIADLEQGRPQDPVQRAQSYVLTHFSEQLSMDDVARRFHLSPAHFSRQFKQLVGQTFSEYVKNLRLESAYWLIISTDSHITDIVYEVGYKDLKYFYQLFKATYGLSPTDLRHKNKNEHPTPPN